MDGGSSFSSFSSSRRARVLPSDGFLARHRAASSFKMQIVALIFALSAPFPFHTELPAIGAERAAHATARMLRTRVRVRAYEGGRTREASVRDDVRIKSRKF